jgi:hypothetical protein
MATNPNVTQGTLNRAKISVSFSDNSEFNISVSNLSPAGVSISPSTPSATLIGTMVGAVASLNPYQLVDITIHLLRTQSLAKKFESRKKSNCSFGTMVMRGDSTSMQPWTYSNGTLVNVDAMNFTGNEVECILRFQAVYNINSDIWS